MQAQALAGIHTQTQSLSCTTCQYGQTLYLIKLINTFTPQIKEDLLDIKCHRITVLKHRFPVSNSGRV